MWNILLVEDEPFVRRSIRNLIDWESAGFAIAGEAGDGEEALHILQCEPPDLVLADIVMPIMNGIELLRQARAGGYDGGFVMLTCMNDFEYARQALELGADGYMLKLSMTVQSLQETLLKIAEELERRSREKLRMTGSLLENLYLEVWSKYADPQSYRRSEEDETGTARTALVESGLSQVAVASVLHDEKSGPLLTHLQGEMEAAYGKPAVFHRFARGGTAHLFAWYRGSTAAIHRRFDSRMETAVALSAPVPLEAFPDIWFRLLRTLDGAWYGRVSIKGVKLVGVDTTTPPYPVWPWKLELDLVQAYERKDRFACRAASDRLCAELERLLFPMAATVKAFARLETVLEQLEEVPGLTSWEPCGIGFHALRDAFCDRIDRKLTRWLTAAAKQTDHEEVNRILDYVHRHYDGNVSLKAMAAMVAMDENYLSGLFKKKTGETLIQYLQRIRVEQAKQLLQRTDLPVLEIGERVGFANGNYFFKIFKRWAGITPSDYRLKPGNPD